MSEPLVPNTIIFDTHLVSTCWYHDPMNCFLPV